MVKVRGFVSELERRLRGVVQSSDWGELDW